MQYRICTLLSLVSSKLSSFFLFIERSLLVLNLVIAVIVIRFTRANAKDQCN